MTFPALEYDILRSIFQHLPSNDLFSVIQACSSFYSLAIDILYQDITYPFADYAQDNSSFWPNIASVHRAVRTVSFTNDPRYMVPKFAIERIPSSGGFDVWPASACPQAPNERTSVLHSSDPRVMGHDSKILPVLQMLSTPSFPFLHTISFVNVVFSSLMGLLSILSGLDSLRTLKIERCDFECQWYSHAHPTVAEIAAFSALPITSLVLRQTSGHHAHLFFCTASHLKSLLLSVGSRWLGPFLAKRLPLSYAFSDELGSLRLEAPVDRYFGGEFGLQVVDFLQNECQNLRELIIDAKPAEEDDGPSSGLDSKATDIAIPALLSPLFMPENFSMPHLPQLESFSGSWGFLHSVLKAGCQLKRIKVADVQSVQDAVSGLEEVASYNSGSALQEIEINVSAWGAEIFDAVSRLFPELRCLRVEHYGHIDISAFERTSLSRLPRLVQFELYNPLRLHSPAGSLLEESGTEIMPISQGFNVSLRYSATQEVGDRLNSGRAWSEDIIYILSIWAKDCPQLEMVRLEECKFVRKSTLTALWERFMDLSV